MKSTIKNLKITEDSNEESIEIRYMKPIDRGVTVPYVLVVASANLPKLILGLKKYLSDFKGIDLNTKRDKIEYGGGGTDIDPLIMMSGDHIRKDGTVEGHTLFIPEKAGPALVKALEKMIKKKKTKAVK